MIYDRIFDKTTLYKHIHCQVDPFVILSSQVRNVCSCIKVAEDFVAPEVCMWAWLWVWFPPCIILNMHNGDTYCSLNFHSKLTNVSN